MVGEGCIISTLIEIDPAINPTSVTQKLLNHGGKKMSKLGQHSVYFFTPSFNEKINLWLK